MNKLQKSMWGCIGLIILMAVIVGLRYIVWPEHADTLSMLVSTLAGMAIVDAINSFEGGSSVGKAVFVVALVLLFLVGVLYMFSGSLAKSFGITAICLVIQGIYVWLQKKLP